MSSITIAGVDSIRDLLNPKRINKAIALEVGLASKNLHARIKSEVFTRYKIRQEKIDSALENKSVSDVTYGKNVIYSNLTYKYTPSGLGSFYTSWQFGNINPGKTHQGTVFSVEVRRGSKKIVYGKGHRGGFIPMNQAGKLKRNRLGGYNMYERTSNKRYPLRLLLAPSISQMITKTIKESKTLDKELVKFEDRLKGIFS